MPIERIRDVIDSPDLWSPPDDGVRIDFDSWGLLEQSGIAHTMAADDEDEYVAHLQELASELGPTVRIRAAPSIGGPAAGAGTPTFIDLFTQAKDWLALAIAIGGAVQWLRRAGVREIRVSERGIESLARRELQSRSLNSEARLVEVTLVPGPASPYTGGPPNYAGYMVTFALDNGRILVLRFSLDGVFEDLIEQ